MNAMKVAGEVKRRESLLDLVRLAACFLVVFHHAAVALIFGDDYEIVTPMLVKLQNVIIRVCTVGEGTPIFFVLAGWLVVNTLEKSAGARKAILISFARRMKRILPPYWLSLGLVALLFYLMDQYGLGSYYSGSYAAEFKSPSELTTWQWIGNLTLTETWRKLYVGDDSEIFTRSAWALCYHEQFVSIVFLCAMIGGLHWKKWLIAVSSVIMVCQIIIYDTGSFHRADGLFLDRWFCFAAGILAYEIKNKTTAKQTKLIYGSMLAVGLVSGLWINDIELFLSAMTALILVGFTDSFQWKCPDKLAAFCGRLSPWTYYVYLVHFPAVTITNRIMVESGLRHFWLRLFIVVPVSTAIGIFSGLLFGLLVRRLESTRIEMADLLVKMQFISGKLRRLLQQTWQEVAVRPILLPSWNLFPRRDRAGAFDHCRPAAGRGLSDQTPWPNATQ